MLLRKCGQLSKLTTVEKVRMYGLPGEAQNLVVIFGTEDFPIGSRPVSVSGSFKVQFLLAKPGRLKFEEEAVSFLSEVVGNSHLAIPTAPLGHKPQDGIVGIVLNTSSDDGQISFTCFINSDGHVGKIVVDNLSAKDYSDAETLAHRALTPFLSTWSLTLDIPLFIETVQITDLTTHTDVLHVRAPYLEMIPPSGATSPLSQDFCQFASVYRDGMNSNSPFYRFLCFYKIVESLYIRRSESAKAARGRGADPRKYSEDVPLSREAMRGILGILYPWRRDWDDFCLDQTLPEEARGKRFKWIRQTYLEPLRNEIAHGLMKSGRIERIADRVEDINAATKWLPLLRVWTRLLLRIDFPDEFGVEQRANL